MVEAVGAVVTEFRVGDEVFGMRGGANAEYVCVREQGALAHKPAGLSFEEAAAVPDGGIIALACLRQGRSSRGAKHRHLRRLRIDRHCVGAARQALRRGGHRRLQHEEHRARALARCRSRSIDYTQEDFTKNGERYDVVFDSVGKHSFRRCRGSLKPGGTYIETDLGFMWHVPPLALLSRWIGDKRVTLPIPKYTKENVLVLKELIEAGEYRAVIDRTYPLEEVVEATRYVETGQKTGNVVLTVDGGSAR